MVKSSLNAENLKQLENKKIKEPPKLEPIENYKGKSLEELEAILDAHNSYQKHNEPKEEEKKE